MSIPKSQYVSSVWKEGIFDNKVIFCTGGAGSICSAQVRALVHLGANAYIVGRNVEKTLAMAKSLATARPGAKVIGQGAVDVRKLESLQDAVSKCVAELGAIDFVIAGAAGNFLAPIKGLSSNAFRTVIDIDVNGSYNTLKATLPQLLESSAKKQGGGRIIFVSATLHYAGTPFQTHASAAKAAVDAVSAHAAMELGPHGITSNVIAPGAIEGTEGMERLSSSSGRANDRMRSTIPLGRMGLVKEIADATVYLFSDAGNYVNGTALVVDGAAWRMGTGMGGPETPYPDFLLGDASFENIAGVKSGRKEKAKL